jgi:hypothetical protein
MKNDEERRRRGEKIMRNSECACLSAGSECAIREARKKRDVDGFLIEKIFRTDSIFESIFKPSLSSKITTKNAIAIIVVIKEGNGAIHKKVGGSNCRMRNLKRWIAGRGDTERGDQGIRRTGDEETSMNAEKAAEIFEIQRISLITLLYYDRIGHKKLGR